MPKRLEPSPELRQALGLILRRVTRMASARNANRFLKSYSGATHYVCGWKFIHVRTVTVEITVLPNGDAYAERFHRGYHQPDWSRPLGNIIRFVQMPDWRRRVRFRLDRYG